MSKQRIILWILLGFAGLVCVLTVLYVYQSVYVRLYENAESVRLKTELRNAMLLQDLRKLEFNFQVGRYTTIGGLVAIPIVGVILVSIFGYCRIRHVKGVLLEKEAAFRQASIFKMELGQYRSLPVRWQDIQYMASVIPQILSVEALASHDTERAFELAERITTHSHKMLSVMKAPPIPLQDPSIAQDALPECPGVSSDFSSILAMMGKGSDLFFGIVQQSKTYVCGSVDDLLSTMVLGESGSGKTSWLRALVAQLVLAYQANIVIYDPHEKNNQSLVKTSYPLTTLPNVTVTTESPSVHTQCRADYQELTRRLSQEEPDDQPYVVVIDELSSWMRSKYKNSIAFLMEKIATEGRKANMYLLCSSTSSLTKRMGGDSVVRDALISSFVFKCKKSVARYLLQDGEDAKQVATIQQKGVALFTPVSRESQLVEVLYAKECDMQIAYHRYETLYGHPQETHTQSVSVDVDFVETDSLHHLHELCDQRNGTFGSKNQWQKAVSEASGISYPLVKNIMSGHAPIVPERIAKLVTAAEILHNSETK